MANDNCVFGGAMTADGADKVSLRIPPLICGFFVAMALRVFLLPPPPPPAEKGYPPLSELRPCLLYRHRQQTLI